jgi:hypothetical protein
MSASHRISRRQERLLERLLAGTSIKDAAAAVGVSERQARRWLRDRNVTEAFAAARRMVFAEAVHKLQAASVDAADTLHRALSDPSPVRVRSAIAILELGRDLAEMVDLNERVGRLERGGAIDK